MPQRDDRSHLGSIRSLIKNAKPEPLKRSTYLEPEDSPFWPTRAIGMRVYESMVAESLVGAAECEAQSLAPVWQREETASLVCIPSFTPEWALWVVGERKAGFWVLLTEAEENIWYSTRSEQEVPRSPSVKKHRTELATELGAAVCDIWSRVLSQTRYPQEPLLGACDGVTYHFAYSRKGMPATAGKTWSPVESTIPGKLTALAHSIKDYVRDPANQDVFMQVINDHLEWFRSHSD